LTTQVPICLAGSDTDSFLTAEPAIVVEDDDIDDGFAETASRQLDIISPDHSLPVSHPPPPVQTTFDEDDSTPLIPTSDQPRMQHGVTVRRAVNKCRRMSMMNHTNINAKILEHLSFDEKSVISPFERSVSSRHMDVCSSPPLSPSTSEISRYQISARHLLTVDSGHLS
jgi:hypothetical protein